MLLFKKSESQLMEVFPGYQGRFIHGSGATIAHWEIKAGSVIPEHRHHHEQIINCITGTFQMVVEGQTYVLEAGDTLVIPANMLHAAMAITDAQCLDVFTPVRDDYQL